MLRIRLVLWYSLLVLLTLVSTGIVVYLLLYSSLTSELENSLAQDARSTLRILSNRPIKSDSLTLKKGIRSKTIRELIDESLENAPKNISGEELSDRVMSFVMDEMIYELSDSVGSSGEEVKGLLQRTLTGRHNYLVEVYKMDSGRFGHVYRSPNLNNDTLLHIFSIDSLSNEDSLRRLGETSIHGESVRAVLSSNANYSIIVANSEEDIHELIGQLIRLYLYIIPLVLLIATVGGIILARKALKPIEDIADTAKEISAKNLSSRIEMPSRNDKELTTLVETLNTMFARLEISYHKIAQFSSDASHELKTPLAILKGEIEVANRRLESAGALTISEAKDLLISMMEEVERMQRIVEGLLLIAKAEDHRLPFEKEATSMYQFLDSIAEDADILAGDKGIIFKNKFAPGTESIILDIDKTRMYQVLMNLIDNALKYTPKDGTVTMFLEAQENSVAFGISDTGPGIPPEDISKVFQRFFRTESARSHGGEEYTSRSLGLGLAITKSIIEAHGGEISVASEVGKGTTFTVTLPLS